MNNVILGKTLKAMYKLSGKTLTQLSDESGLTLDTINNLFYARIQKPGLAGVNALVDAMGFSIGQLMAFLGENTDLPEDCDVTELFTKYSTAAGDTGVDCDVTELFTKYSTAAGDTGVPAEPAKGTVRAAKGGLAAEIEAVNAEHERQLDRFRAAHQRYEEQLKEQHRDQIAQMEAHSRQMEQHYAESEAELRNAYEQQTGRLEKENARLGRAGRRMSLVLAIETGLILLLLILDTLNRTVGWIR